MSDRLPSFLVIGARRAGTTSLYDYLTAHPRIAKAKRKELHFFDREYHRGTSWYRSQFPGSLALRRNVITGEATPYYLFHPEVPDRVKATLPDAKFFAILRNPIDRAFSHFQTGVRRGWETLSFEEAIDAEPERIGGLDEQLHDPKVWSFEHSNYSYLARGRYARQLDAWFERFDRDRFNIVIAEDMYRDPAAVVRDAYAFVGVDEFVPASFPHRNNQQHGETMAPETRAKLIEMFRAENQRLYDLLGRDLGWDR